MAISKLQIGARMARRVLGSAKVWAPLAVGSFFVWIAPPAGFFAGLAYVGWALCAVAGWRVIKPIALERDQLLSNSLSDIRKQRQKQHAKYLRALLPSIRKDRDPRTSKILKDLERIHERMLRLESDATQKKIGGMSSLMVRANELYSCLLYTSPSPRDATLSRMPSSA